MCGHTRDRLYLPSFIEIRSGVSEPRGGGQNLAFPITLASRFYNSLYCRTSHDILLLMLAYLLLLCVRFSISILSQEIGREERLRNDLSCVAWDVKP